MIVQAAALCVRVHKGMIIFKECPRENNGAFGKLMFLNKSRGAKGICLEYVALINTFM